MEPIELTDTEQEVVRRGLAAADLLASESFRSTIKSLQFENWAQFTETRPEDKDKREHLYNLYAGLKAIEEELNVRVQQKDEIERRLNAEQNDQAELF